MAPVLLISDLPGEPVFSKRGLTGVHAIEIALCFGFGG